LRQTGAANDNHPIEAINAFFELGYRWGGEDFSTDRKGDALDNSPGRNNRYI
jgi:hypothetical protein